MFLLGSGRFARVSPVAGAAERSKSLLQPARSRLCARNRCSSLLGAASALEIAAPACSGPPVRSKSQAPACSEPPLHSKSQFEDAGRYYTLLCIT